MDGFQYSGPVKQLEVLRLEIAATRRNVKAWGVATHCLGGLLAVGSG